MAKSRCSSLETIPKETVLAMLEARSVIGYKEGESVQYTKNGITYFYRVSAVSGNNLTLTNTNETIVVPSSDVKSVNEQDTFLDKLKTSEWSVMSFDSRTRTVCINIKNGKTTINMTVVLPVIDSNTLKL